MMEVKLDEVKLWLVVVTRSPLRRSRYYKNIQNLTEQLRQAHVNGTLGILRVAKSATHPDPKKFNDDKTKLEAFLAQLNLKLQRNIDHFNREGQNTEENKLTYAISRLEGDAFAQIEPYVSAENIDFENINQFVEILNTCFGEVNPVGTAKHKLYQLYQTNKDLEVFLNTFLRLSKKAKIDDSQPNPRSSHTTQPLLSPPLLSE